MHLEHELYIVIESSSCFIRDFYHLSRSFYKLFNRSFIQKNPNFGTEVTKEQTTQLLKKLFRANIIENVREDAGEEEFKVVYTR